MALPISKNIDHLDIDDLLTQAYNLKASDIHLSCGTPPKFRIDGDLLLVPGYSEVTPEWLYRQIEKTGKDKVKNFREDWDADFAHEVDGVSRFRVNAFMQQKTPGAVFRIIPNKIANLKELGAPPIFGDLTKRKSGLILVTGPTGSGKSTTLAAMINEINETRAEHIMTIEDPVEFVHKNKMAHINQREVETDVKSFAEALKRVLRQDPDIILLGELRDAETISTALTAAETGHLVFGTLHTQSAAKTIDRIIDSFPSEQQNQVRSQLSDTLQAVISQALVKRKGGGRVAVNEILINTPAIANNIREGNISGINNVLTTSKQMGMHTMDQNIVEIVKKDLSEKDDVIDLIQNKALLDGLGLKNDWGF